MKKKYELIETGLGWFRIKSMRDFRMRTGQRIKYGKLGGYVLSDGCLSHEGLCWIKDNACVSGKVSENAIVRCDAIVEGIVSGNAVIDDSAIVEGTISGNTIVKDNAYVGPNATVTGEAMVKADQWIRYGTVTTDLLGTNDLTGALYAELGIKPKNGKVILYKQVLNTDNPKIFKSWYKNSFLYEIGKEAVENDVNTDVTRMFGRGLHFTTLEFIDCYEGDTILECEINVKDILTVQENKVRAKKCRVIKKFIRKRNNG